jgi:hypothetical protein
MNAKLLTFAIALLSSRAFCAPHLEPCHRVDDYEERVERLLRDAWPEQLQLLVVMYGLLNERGVGITSGADGFNLVRLEFDKSFWYSSWRTVDPDSDPAAVSNAHFVATEVFREDGKKLETQVLDFSGTRVRVFKTSVPISDHLGRALLDDFRRSADAARPEVKGPGPIEEIIVDGYKFEVLLAEHPCVELANPPMESEAGRLDQLARLLGSELLAWRPGEAEEFERKVMEAIAR